MFSYNIFMWASGGFNTVERLFMKTFFFATISILYVRVIFLTKYPDFFFLLLPKLYAEDIWESDE